MQISNAGVAGSYIHGGKNKGAALNLSTQNPQGSMNSMRLRNLKGGKYLGRFETVIETIFRFIILMSSFTLRQVQDRVTTKCWDQLLASTAV